MGTPAKSMPVMPAMCATCPFREGSPVAYLRESIAESAQVNGRICHSTHKRSAVYANKPPIKGGPQICRGARDLQLKRIAAMGFIDAPTDEAWQKKCDEIGIVRDRIK